MAIVVLIFSITVMFFRIELIQVNGVINASGSILTYTFVIIGIILLAILAMTLRNIKKIDRRYFPIFAILGILMVFLVLIVLFPGIILYDFGLAIFCYIMYFTIENPDIKMIKELEMAKARADRANNAKTDFLSSMSHEIRTPLNAIVGFSQSLQNAKTLEDALEDANDILTASNSLLDIVSGVLDISKIEADKIEIEK